VCGSDDDNVFFMEHDVMLWNTMLWDAGDTDGQDYKDLLERFVILLSREAAKATV